MCRQANFAPSQLQHATDEPRAIGKNERHNHNGHVEREIFDDQVLAVPPVPRPRN